MSRSSSNQSGGDRVIRRAFIIPGRPGSSLRIADGLNRTGWSLNRPGIDWPSAWPVSTTGIDNSASDRRVLSRSARLINQGNPATVAKEDPGVHRLRQAAFQCDFNSGDISCIRIAANA